MLVGTSKLVYLKDLEYLKIVTKIRKYLLKLIYKHYYIMEINKYSFYNDDNNYLKLKINLKQIGGSHINDSQEPIIEYDEESDISGQFNSNINFYELYSLDDPKFKIEEVDVSNVKKEYLKKTDIIPSQDYYLHDLIKIHGIFDNIEEYNYLDYGTDSGYQPTVLYAISKNQNLGLNLSIDATTSNNEVSKITIIKN